MSTFWIVFCIVMVCALLFIRWVMPARRGPRFRGGGGATFHSGYYGGDDGGGYDGGDGGGDGGCDCGGGCD
jgi:hypothetical protein